MDLMNILVADFMWYQWMLLVGLIGVIGFYIIYRRQQM